MDSTIISVIIPTYNPNLCYLEELLKSFSNVDHSKIEILLIDDGSDNLHAIKIREYCSLFHINYLSYEKNHGVSYARNFGIKNSKGEYIIFCDSDDLINVDLINSILKQNLTSDLYLFGYSSFYPFKESKNVLNTKKLHKDDSLQKFFGWPYLGEDCYSFRGCVCKLFKKPFLLKNDIFFQENLHFCEDTAFMLECFNHSDNISICEKSFLYYIRQNENSATHKWNNNYNNLYLAFYNYVNSKINDKTILFPVYRDTICIYSKVRICSSFKHFKIKQGLAFIKLPCVLESCKKIKDYDYKLSEEKEKFSKLIVKGKYMKAYLFIIKNKLLHRS